MMKTMRRCLTVTTAIFLAAHALPPTAHAQIQTTSTIYGATYGELGARWWEWLLSIPGDRNPNLDGTGTNCGAGQVGAIWFLAGTFGGTATRACTVPAGRAIFFPIINNVAFLPAPTETTLDLRKQAAGPIDAATHLKCTLDERPCAPNLFELRAQSPIFEVIVPAGGLVAPGTYNPMVAAGYWALLTPLQPGHHVLKFGGTGTGISVDVTYNLTILANNSSEDRGRDN